jgi:hypothetical protein
MGLGLLAKYSILLLVAAFGLYCLLTPSRRWAIGAWGPCIALIIALVVASPHLYWLATESTGPLAYVAESKGTRGAPAAPLPHAGVFLGHQLVISLPVLAVVAVWAMASGRPLPALAIFAEEPRQRREAVRFLVFVTIVPIVLTVAAALALRKQASVSWSYTFPITAGLLAVLAWPWLERDLSERRMPHAAMYMFMACALTLAVVWPIPHWVKAVLGRPPPRTAYDGAAHGTIVDAFWEKRRQGPLRYQVSHFGTGDERALGSATAYFSRYRPSVFHGADSGRSPWIDLDDYRRNGGVLITERPIPSGAAFAGLCVTEVERFARPTVYRGYQPTYFYVGLLAPSPEPKSSCP